MGDQPVSYEDPPHVSGMGQGLIFFSVTKEEEKPGGGSVSKPFQLWAPLWYHMHTSPPLIYLQSPHVR